MQFQQRIEKHNGVYWPIIVFEHDGLGNSGRPGTLGGESEASRRPVCAPRPEPPALAAAGSTKPREGRAPRRHRDLVSTSSLQQAGRQTLHRQAGGQGGRCASRWKGRQGGR